jgi:uncharacterized protein YceH (UPF0502 family)
MDINLTLYETRVIGCLLEKEITTPDQYPLSLNALQSACNQKSNRDPVIELDERTVQETVDELIRKHLVSDRSGFGSRVVKYQHRFCNTEFSSLKFTAQELGIVCVLLLRGPQTPGELRTHAQRLCRFADLREVEETLKGLTEREDGPFVMRLPREVGRREARYAHLFSGEVEIPVDTGPPPRSAGLTGADRERLERLEQMVGEMRAELERLREGVEALRGPATSSD